MERVSGKSMLAAHKDDDDGLQRKVLWSNPILRKKLRKYLEICISKINTRKSQDMQISQQLKDSSYEQYRKQYILQK